MAYHPELWLMSANQNIMVCYFQFIIYLGWPSQYGTISQIITYIGLPRYHGAMPLNRLSNHGIVQFPEIAVYFGLPKYHGIMQYLQNCCLFWFSKGIMVLQISQINEYLGSSNRHMMMPKQAICRSSSCY